MYGRAKDIKVINFEDSSFPDYGIHHLQDWLTANPEVLIINVFQGIVDGEAMFTVFYRE